MNNKTMKFKMSNGTKTLEVVQKQYTYVYSNGQEIAKFDNPSEAKMYIIGYMDGFEHGELHQQSKQILKDMKIKNLKI